MEVATTTGGSSVELYKLKENGSLHIVIVSVIEDIAVSDEMDGDEVLFRRELVSYGNANEAANQRVQKMVEDLGYSTESPSCKHRTLSKVKLLDVRWFAPDKEFPCLENASYFLRPVSNNSHLMFDILVHRDEAGEVSASYHGIPLRLEPEINNAFPEVHFTFHCKVKLILGTITKFTDINQVDGYQFSSDAKYEIHVFDIAEKNIEVSGVALNNAPAFMRKSLIEKSFRGMSTDVGFCTVVVVPFIGFQTLSEYFLLLAECAGKGLTVAVLQRVDAPYDPEQKISTLLCGNLDTDERSNQRDLWI